MKLASCLTLFGDLALFWQEDEHLFMCGRGHVSSCGLYDVLGWRQFGPCLTGQWTKLQSLLRIVKKLALDAGISEQMSDLAISKSGPTQMLYYTVTMCCSLAGRKLFAPSDLTCDFLESGFLQVIGTKLILAAFCHNLVSALPDTGSEAKRFMQIILHCFMDPKKWQCQFDKLEQEDNAQAKFLSDYVGMHSDHEEATRLRFAVLLCSRYSITDYCFKSFIKYYLDAGTARQTIQNS